MTATFAGRLENMVARIIREKRTARHVDLVAEVLRRGYVHKGSEPLSRAVHSCVRELMAEGLVNQIEDEETGSREYEFSV